MKDDYIVALNLAPTTPKWLLALGAKPMKLGLDLSGGVHFLLEVDINPVIETRLNSIQSEIKSALREDDIRYQRVMLTKDQRLLASFKTEALRQRANSYIGRQFPQLVREITDEAGSSFHYRSTIFSRGNPQLLKIMRSARILRLCATGSTS